MYMYNTRRFLSTVVYGTTIYLHLSIGGFVSRYNYCAVSFSRYCCLCHCIEMLEWLGRKHQAWMSCTQVSWMLFELIVCMESLFYY